MASRPRISPQPVSLTAARQALGEAVDDEPAVVAAYVFGSVARGTAGPLSDLDIGLLVDDHASDEGLCDRVWADVCRRLRTSSVDVVSLLHAPMPLRYRVARDGSVVMCRDAAARQRFEAESVLHYLDFAPVRERAFASLRDGIIAAH